MAAAAAAIATTTATTATTGTVAKTAELFQLSFLDTKFLCIMLDTITRRGLFGAGDMRTYGDLYQRIFEIVNTLQQLAKEKRIADSSPDLTSDLPVNDCILMMQAIESGAVHGGIFLAIEYKDLGDVYNKIKQWADQNVKVENATFELNEGRTKFYASLIDILARRGVYGCDEFLLIGELYSRLKKSSEDEKTFLSMNDCRVILQSIEAGSKRKGPQIFMPNEFYDVGMIYMRLKLWYNKYQQQVQSKSNDNLNSLQSISLKDIE